MRYHLLYSYGEFKIVETGKTITSPEYEQVVFSSDNLQTVIDCSVFCMGYLSSTTNPNPEVLKDIINDHFVLNYSKIKLSIFLDDL